MSNLFAFDWTVTALLITHGIIGVVTTGASVHHGLLCWRACQGVAVEPRLRRLYPQVMVWGYGLAVALGLLVYPAFVQDVRMAGLDTALPWATGLFEVKEHWAAIAFGTLLFYHAPMARRLDARSAPDRVFDITGMAVAVVTLYVAISGEIVVSLGAP